MIDSYKEKYLVWAMYFGFFVFICAPWVLSSNTPYHKLIILFVWIPALIHVCFYFQRYQSVSRVGACLYLFSAAWFSFVVILHARDLDDLRELKMPFYVGLTLVGFYAIAEADIDRFRKFLLFAAVIGGFGAWASWGFFYLVEGKALLSRHPAIGLWSVIIPAAQAVGALMLLVVCLGLKAETRPLINVGVVVSLAGYCVFLISNQSRGVWVALLAAFLVVVLLMRNRKIYLFMGAFLISLILLYFLNDTIFLKRGVSFRSEIWKQGLMHASNNWKTGLGFEKFKIIIASTDNIFSHPHNMYIDIAIRFGLAGLVSWLLLWGWAIGRAYRFRSTSLGQAALALLVYSSVVVLTDGIAQWMKPNPGWFVTWLPLALVFVLGCDKEKSLPELRTDQQ